jgi:hypothetical protein
MIGSRRSCIASSFASSQKLELSNLLNFGALLFTSPAVASDR